MKESTVLAHKVGRLSLVKELPSGLIKATCDVCNYPVVMDREDWGKILGCNATCAAEEERARQREVEEERRERMADEREKARAARLRQTYLLPHFSDLDSKERRLFKTLAEQGAFTVGHVAALLRCSTEDAWESISRMLDANLLVEMCGVLGESRPYSPDSAYAAGASKYSTYVCRRLAMKQMEHMEEPAAKPAPQAVERQAILDLTLEFIKQFVSQRCKTGEAESEHEIVLRAKAVAWAESQHVGVPTLQDWASALDAAGYDLRGGKRRGVRLKRSGELIADAMTQAQSVA